MNYLRSKFTRSVQINMSKIRHFDAGGMGGPSFRNSTGVANSDIVRATLLSRWMTESVCTYLDAYAFVIVLSHWPHVATHVATQVAAHVASVKAL